uniref:Uncharacterized protein n=1 Tax=Anguilla anguilla TaxID=7936 RepID=A0A0E9WEE3_ANGAN
MKEGHDKNKTKRSPFLSSLINGIYYTGDCILAMFLTENVKSQRYTNERLINIVAEQGNVQ